MTHTILEFASPATTLALAGRKGMNLAELARASFPVPPGFLIST
jgi:phosphoenolpyruvate synthase/pyruvate phosphate dikinase